MKLGSAATDAVVAETHDFEAKRAQAILTPLLLIEDIGVGLARVLQAAVELPDRRLLVPQEVDDADQSLAVEDLHLLLRRWQPDGFEGDARQRFTR